MITRRGILQAATAAVATLRASFSTALDAGEGKWNLLFPRGTWHGANLAPIGGSIDLSSGILEEMVASWEAAGKPKLPVRKTHRHLDDDVPAVDRPELEKAFGWLTDLRATDAGLEALTEWTPAGKACVDAKEFSFWSPEWQPQHTDRRSGERRGWWVSGVALTNDPFFNQMPPVAAAASSTDSPAAKEHPMNEQQLNQLRASLGLAATATAEEVLAAAAKIGADIKTLKAAQEKTTVTAASIKEAVLQATEPLVAQLKATDAELLEMKVANLIATAKKGDGKMGRALVEEKVKPVLLKLIAAESSRDEGLKAAAAFLEAIPATVPTAPVGHSTKDEGALTPEAANIKLQAAADELRAKGVKGADAMLQAMAQNPAWTKAARALTLTTQKES